MPDAPRSERTIIFLVGAVQFINVLDFVMVLPLGPDFARALNIAPSHLGIIGGAYTAAAALGGVLGSLFLDRFDRRKALAVAMTGLVIGTAGGAVALGLYTLVAARIVAGLFGGPAASLALSIVADVVPVERRGKAMGAVMSAFSIASVVGIPAGLKLSEVAGWHAPFLGTAALGAVVTVLAVAALPPLRGHLSATGAVRPSASYGALLGNPLVRQSYLMTWVGVMAAFILIPNISAYVQTNLGYPRGDLDQLYFVGGIASFITMRVVGRLVDRYGAARMGSMGAVLLAVVIVGGFGAVPPVLPVMAVFVLFMVANNVRNVSGQTLASRVPGPAERARFTSLGSTVQHLSSAVAAVLSSQLLSEDATGRLVGMERVVVASVVLGLLLPVIMVRLERALRRRDAANQLPGVGTATT